MTPEGKVKKKVSKYLADLPNCWYNMPVPGGYGRPLLDYIGSLCGQSFAIETKAPGEKPTPRQEATMEDMQRGGVRVFVVDCGERYPMEPFVEWAQSVLDAQAEEKRG